MSRLGDVLRRLLRRGYITKEEALDNDYDLLTEVLKRRKQNKARLEGLNNSSLALDAYMDIINDPTLQGHYNEEELLEIFENIKNEY